MNIRIHANGCVDIIEGDMGLLGGYPALDGTSVHPVGIETGADRVLYRLSDTQSIELTVRNNDGTLLLNCRTKGLGAAHDIAVLAGLKIVGCDRAFYQGMAIAQPTGFMKITPAPPRSRSYFGNVPETKKEVRTSDALTAVGNAAKCLTLHVCDQTRFRSYFSLDGDQLDILYNTEGALKEEESLPEITIREGADFSSALRKSAEDIACVMHARPPKTPAFHWCSWYYLYYTLDQKTLEEYLAGFRKYSRDIPFRYIQIDAGTCTALGDWLEPNERFPKGLAYAADTIRQAGFEPGIWIGPFMVGEESRLFREHPDWILHDLEGRPMPVWHFYNEPKLWAYRDSEYYVLDSSHPEAMAYMKHVFETLHNWGFTLYKTDFMLWGLQDSTRVRRYTPGKTSVEYFRDFLAMVREAIGSAAWLGCVAPFMPFLGYADMMRIGADVGAQWNDTQFGPENMLMEIRGSQYFNHVFWQNDPDAVLLRDFHISLTQTEIEALALLQAVSGGVITTSDPVHLIAPDRRKLLKLIRPDGVVQPEFPQWEDDRPEILVVARTRKGSLVYLMNPTQMEITVPCDWTKWLGKGSWHLWQLHIGPSTAEKTPWVRLSPRSGVLFFASREVIEQEPENLWDWDDHASEI